MDTQPGLDQAAQALKSGQMDVARQVLDGLVTAQPDNAAAWELLFSALDDPREKHDCLKQVVRIRPKDVEARTKLKKYEASEEYREEAGAQSLAKQQREKKARERYKRKERLKRSLSSLLSDLAGVIFRGMR